jgi:hypothetical protein
VLDRMKNFLPIVVVLAAFIIAGAATARVRTIHHRVPHDSRPLHMQEGPSLQEGPCHMARPHNGRPVPDCVA